VAVAERVSAVREWPPRFGLYFSQKNTNAEGTGKKFVPEKETEMTFSGRFFDHFFVVRYQIIRLNQKNTLLLENSCQKGGLA
jgi:hypothetical protein